MRFLCRLSRPATGYLVASGEWYARRLRSRASCIGKPPLRSRLRCLLTIGCKGLGFAFTKPSICCIGCCREGRAGRGAEATSKPTAFFGRHEIFRKPGKSAVFSTAYSLASGSTKLADSTEPIVPASPNRPAVPDARCPQHLNLQGWKDFYFWFGQPEGSHLKPNSHDHFSSDRKAGHG